jgi:predicted transcriptional regulator YdeE
MKVLSISKKVWSITSEGIEPLKKVSGSRFKIYRIPSNAVGVKYEEKNNKFTIYAGYKADSEKSMSLLIDLALRLDVRKVELGDVEKIQHLKKWDDFVQKLQKIIDLSQEGD